LKSEYIMPIIIECTALGIEFNKKSSDYIPTDILLIANKYNYIFKTLEIGARKKEFWVWVKRQIQRINKQGVK